jgi:LysM repeat protein
MRLTDQQIARFVAQGGFTGDNRVTAIAIVLAESGGVTDILGDTTIETDVFGPSVGLFQIRSVRTERGTGSERDELANLDPATNARHAHQIYVEAGSRFTDWSTFTTDAYRQFLDRARAALGGGFGPDDGSVHIVEQGETLSGIASSHGLSLDQLQALNPGLFDAAHHHGELIQPGEHVILSGHTGHSGHTRVVQPGDTLSGIASSHGLSLDQLQALNPGLFDAAHHHGELIQPGEVVQL